VFFGFLPIALMFIERLKSPKQIIVKPLWYGIFIIISAFILRTLAVYQVQTGWSLIDDRYFGRQIRGYSPFELALDILKSIGADEVIDYQTEDIRKNNQSYDLIFDAVMKNSKKQIKTILKKDGTFLSVKSMTKELNI